MRKCLVLASFLSCLPAVALADGAPPFQITYQPSQVVVYPETTASKTKITVANRSGDRASDVVVSIPAQEPVDAYTMRFADMADGYEVEFLKTVLAPSEAAAASLSEASVIWHVEYTNAAGERTSVDLAGEPAL